MVRHKHPPVRLNAESYEALRHQVLRRDGWRCQACGWISNLEVHHKDFRSHGGEDRVDNLITLCARCHREIHRHPTNMKCLSCSCTYDLVRRRSG